MKPLFLCFLLLAWGLSAQRGYNFDAPPVVQDTERGPQTAGPAAIVAAPPQENLADFFESVIHTKMIFVRGDSFKMGFDEGDRGEGPAHNVVVNSFYIAQTEVTQAQWREVMKNDPPNLYNSGCGECPVDKVSWDDAQAFIQKLNALTGKHYRLPTEAEWEFAARGGYKSLRFRYAGSNNVDKVAWHDGNYQSDTLYGSQKTTHPVKKKAPNELGIYDMSGNVWEWCSDWYDEHFYAKCPPENPHNTEPKEYRVARGGSCNSYPQSLRVSLRGNFKPNTGFFLLGFRLASNCQ